jgi:two-component system NarL family sensor kinase
MKINFYICVKLKPVKIKCFISLFILLLLFSAQVKSQSTTAKSINESIIAARSKVLKDTVETKNLLQKAISDAVSIKNDTCLAKAYEVYGIMYAKRGLNRKGLEYFNKEYDASKRSGFKFHIATSLQNMSNVQSELGDNKGSINSSLQALAIFQKLNNKAKEANALMNLGITYISLGDYSTAMQYQLKALEIREKLNNKYDLAYSQHALAALYNRMKNNDKALEYNFKALKSFQELKDESISSSIIFNIATIRIRTKSYDEAKKNIESIIPYFEKLNKAESLRKCYTQLINIADLQGDEAGSEKYLAKAVEYSKLNGSATNDVDVWLNRCRLNMVNKKYDEAENDLYKAQEIAKKSKDHFNIINVKRQFIALYNESGQGKKAEKMLNDFVKLKDSVLNETNILKLNELNTKYETEKKEAAITLLNKENNFKQLQLKNNFLEIAQNKFLIDKQNQSILINQLEIRNKNQLVKNQQLDANKKAQNIKSLKKQSQIQNLEIENKKLELKQKNIWLIFGGILFLTSLISAFFIYRNYQHKQEKRLQKEIFLQQELETKALFEGEQNERIRIARDLHDSVGQMLSLVKMNLSSQEQNPETENIQGLVDNTISEVRNISHNLIPEELNFGIFPALENLSDKVNASSKTKMEINIPEEIKEIKFQKQNELSIYRIVQEVVNNMIKHADASSIDLSISKLENSLIINIKDNGKGLDDDSISKSSGIGWKNINARVHMMDGKIKIESEKLAGTQIEITLPQNG